MVFTSSFESAAWYKNLNFGALIFTPFWLFSNGFWVLAISYLVAWAIWPLFGIVASIFLFVEGTSMSWGGGARWGYDSEAFMDEQVFWSWLAWFFTLPMCATALFVFLYVGKD